MFQTFTGSSRRPRQVNLSGRVANPFAQPGALPSSHNAVVNAQQNRLARHLERERIKAAGTVQRTWRGHRVRKQVREHLREQWDKNEADIATSNAITYGSQKAALAQLLLLVKFARLSDPGDRTRLIHFRKRKAATDQQGDQHVDSVQWSKAYLSLEKCCLDALHDAASVAYGDELLDTLLDVSPRVQERLQKQANYYYHTIALSLKHMTIPFDLIFAPLSHINTSTIFSYSAFAFHFLTIPDLQQKLGDQNLQRLSEVLNSKILLNAVTSLLGKAGPGPALRAPTADQNKRSIIPHTPLTYPESRIWLLAHLLSIYSDSHGTSKSGEALTSSRDLVYVVATLLSSVVDNLDLDFQNHSHNTIASSKVGTKVRDPFVTDQLSSLVTHENMRGVLSQITAISSLGQSGKQSTNSEQAHSRILANFLLTLFRLFPSKGEEMRMWLYLGSNASTEVPAVKFFWNAVQSTSIFQQIFTEPKTAIALLTPRPTADSLNNHRLATEDGQIHQTDDQWRLILLFFELYTFALRVMDDDEFFGSEGEFYGRPAVRESRKFTNLYASDIASLIAFLKHLGFTMYYNAADILGTREEQSQKSIADMFKPFLIETEDERRSDSTQIAGLSGTSLDYVKGLVTGLLRAVYERDSRRPFLPAGHWLLTSRFDMSNFIDAVVEEEERRSQVQDADDEDDGTFLKTAAEVGRESPSMIGAGREQQSSYLENIRRQQRMASRRKYLQAVAPRLEILQNMPFLIPFATRVQIFRRFIHMDELKRRSGTNPNEFFSLDPFHSQNGHSASIRREHEFEDAFEQFFDLGDALKEPIRITFLDRWNEPEAGIDGGGVTKEFLTSITNQVFSDTSGIRMFVENDQNLLYPNPAAVDEQKELANEVGYRPDSSMTQSLVLELLKRYEFLGRIIGKCLYDGILIDVGFAGFFLLKWALTGGTGSAPKESGYRAHLNDLRDMDEGLYQGLLQLKNYPGSVEQDFSLNFTVTDTISLPPTGKHGEKTRTVTRDLVPGGSSVPVTNANRLHYISLIARHRLSRQPYAQTSAFLKGLAAMISPSWLSMFNQAELQTLVGGAPTPLDVADLRRNTIYGGTYVIGDDGLEHESVQLFWQVLQEMDDKERRKVLKYVTSTPRAPLLGFGTLNPQFSIRDAGSDETRLPSTSTCVNLLKLPMFRSKEKLRDKLGQAINSGAGFDLS